MHAYTQNEEINGVLKKCNVMQSETEYKRNKTSGCPTIVQ